MVKVFISTATQQLQVAEELAFSLRGIGYQTILADEDLPAGVNYVRRVREGILQSDLYVFLISPEAVLRTSYTLSELQMVMDKWPHPKGRVIPVLAVPTPFSAIPAYLQAVKIIQTEGNIAVTASDAVIACAEQLPAGKSLTSVTSWLRTLFRAGKEKSIEPIPQKKKSPQIFISYRRRDSEDFTYRLCDRLQREFGRRNVFIDIDSIPIGTDYVAHIEETIAAAGVLVAVIGPHWLGLGTNGLRRIDDAADPVRTELVSALKKKVPIVPVLTRYGAMPEERELPNELTSISRLNAAKIDSSRDFDAHVGKLIAAIWKVAQVDMR